ncbi:MAG: threonine/serine exporter family protein [Clostridia bacterium]|nr:threonine/serine exporter family protein [Clostridia bacterium]
MEIQPNEKNYGRILKCAMSVGEQMLISGTDVNRVEDSIVRMCRAYGAVRVDVLSITSSIITTIETPEGDCITQTRRITSRTNDLMRIEALNRLSRRICETRPTMDEIDAELKKISTMKPLRWYFAALAAIIVASSFTVFFGGTWRDAIAAGLAGIVVFAFERAVSHVKNNKIVFNLLASILGGAFSVGTVRIGLGENLDFIMIGVIMLLIPGMAMTGAIEDLLMGDTITGLLRLCESVIAACAIAAGFAVATYVCGATELINLSSKGDPHKLVQLAMALISALGFALKLGMKRPTRLTAAAIGGLIGWGAYLLAAYLGCNDFAACFIAAAAGALYSQIMARTMHATATVFLVPAVIPLVPGRALYYTLSSMLHGRPDLVSGWGSTTALEALAIALGMVAVLVVVSGIMTVKRQLLLRKAK